MKKTFVVAALALALCSLFVAGAFAADFVVVAPVAPMIAVAPVAVVQPVVVHPVVVQPVLPVTPVIVETCAPAIITHADHGTGYTVHAAVGKLPYFLTPDGYVATASGNGANIYMTGSVAYGCCNGVVVCPVHK